MRLSKGEVMRERHFEGLSTVNIELTDRCNKNCWFCGRRKREREHPEIIAQYGDIDFDLLEKIAHELPPNIVVQLHNNGESTLYPRFGEAAKLFSRQITNIVTNGSLLLKRMDHIVGNLDTITVSVIENDPDGEAQLDTIREFIRLKGEKRPQVILRFNGNVDAKKYEDLNLIKARRILHDPMGSFNYKKPPTIPEIGICWDFLHHMAINHRGEVSICVRYDPEQVGVIGDAQTERLVDVWNSPQREEWLEYHKTSRRDLVPLCKKCDFWGVPTSP